jgi:hypothetical protein
MEIVHEAGVVDNARIIDVGEIYLDGCAKGHDTIPPSWVGNQVPVISDPQSKYMDSTIACQCGNRAGRGSSHDFTNALFHTIAVEYRTHTDV